MINRIFVIVALIVLLSPIGLINVQAGNIEMTDEQNVKLARNRAMLRVLRGTQGDDYYDDDTEERIREGLDNSGCGSVDIGNTLVPDFGGPKEINVIITGDVINANNKCK